MTEFPPPSGFTDAWDASRFSGDFSMVEHWFAPDARFSSGSNSPETRGIEPIRAYWQTTIADGVPRSAGGQIGLSGVKLRYVTADGTQLEENFILNSEGRVVNGWATSSAVK